MKKFLFFLILAALYSCKKEDTVQLRFTPSITGEQGYVWHWDSILYTTVYYSDNTEIKTLEELNDPEVYHHTVNMDIRNDFLTFVEGRSCIIKKFDIVAKSGEVMFYIPYNGQPGSDKVAIKLPYRIGMNYSMSLAISVIRYPKQL